MQHVCLLKKILKIEESTLQVHPKLYHMTRAIPPTQSYTKEIIVKADVCKVGRADVSWSRKKPSGPTLVPTLPVYIIYLQCQVLGTVFHFHFLLQESANAHKPLGSRSLWFTYLLIQSAVGCRQLQFHPLQVELGRRRGYFSTDRSNSRTSPPYHRGRLYKGYREVLSVKDC